MRPEFILACVFAHAVRRQKANSRLPRIRPQFMRLAFQGCILLLGLELRLVSPDATSAF
jgi:hypothetical protein